MSTHYLLPRLICNQGKAARCIELLQKMTDYSLTEKGNQAYCFSNGIDEQDTVLGFEQYTDRSALDDVHLQSQDFKDFVKTLTDEKILASAPKMDNYTYVDGFLTRSSTDQAPKDTFVWLAEVTFKDEESRSQGYALVKPLAAYVKENEPKTLSYIFLQSIENPLKMAVWEQYTEKDALFNIHHKSPQFAHFSTSMRENGYAVDKKSTGWTTSVGYLQKN